MPRRNNNGAIEPLRRLAISLVVYLTMRDTKHASAIGRHE